MTIIEANEVRKYINKNHPDKSEELLQEFQRYVDTNNAIGSNKMTFVNLPDELRKAIAKTKGNSKGKIYK